MKEPMLEGHITISRPTCSDGSKRIDISISDSESSMVIVSCHMKMEDFAEALTGLAHSPVKLDRVITPERCANVGKKRTVRSLKIPRGDGYVAKYTRDKDNAFETYLRLELEKSEEFKKLQEEGWTIDSLCVGARQPDLENHAISMVKYV